MEKEKELRRRNQLKEMNDRQIEEFRARKKHERESEKRRAVPIAAAAAGFSATHTVLTLGLVAVWASSVLQAFRDFPLPKLSLGIGHDAEVPRNEVKECRPNTKR